MSGYAAIILAAGQATRYHAAGGPEETKLLASMEGEPLVRRVGLAACRSLAAPIIVVTGHASRAVAEALAGLAVTVVHNPDYETGMASSLHRGLEAVPDDRDGAIVLLGDMPGISHHVVDALLARATAPDLDAVVPVREGQRGNPVVLKRSLFRAAMTLFGDTGARKLLLDPGIRVAELDIADGAIFHDVDLPGHLEPRHALRA